MEGFCGEFEGETVALGLMPAEVTGIVGVADGTGGGFHDVGHRRPLYVEDDSFNPAGHGNASRVEEGAEGGGWRTVL